MMNIFTPIGIIVGILTLSLCIGLILVLMLQPRRGRSNHYLITFLFALVVWDLGNVMRNIPEMRILPEAPTFYLLVSGFGASSFALYWFTLSFCDINTTLSRRLKWGAVGIYVIFFGLLWTGNILTDVRLASTDARGYTLQPLGWFGLGLIVSYAVIAFIYQWLSRNSRAKMLLLPTFFLIGAYVINAFDALSYTPADTIFVALSALVLGREVLRLELFSPLAEANQQMRVVNQDLRQAIIELSTERDKVKVLNEELSNASRYKSEFLANMSHELRTPLNSIVGYSELLLQNLYGPLSEKQRDRLEKVHRNGRNLLSIINDILDLSKIEAGRLDMSLTMTDLEPLIEEVLPTIEPQAQTKGLNLKVELQTRMPQILADPIRIRQILINLLSNAVKFTKEGNVTLQVCSILVKNGQSNMMPLPITGWLSDGYWAIVSVSDTGIGIAPENQAEIFEEFKQIDSSTSREFEGTGLGLAITKRLVEMHNGRIWLKSVLGVGTTFFVALPAEASQAYAMTPEPVQIPMEERQTVLVICDDADIADSLTAYLDDEGYRTIRAHNGTDGIEMARQHHPDTIMVEIATAGIKGWELIGTLTADPVTAHIPLIIGSVIDGAPTGIALGPTNHIAKPVQPARLQETLQRLGVSKSGLPVMLVTDNPDERDMLETYLTAEGFQVMGTSSGREAISWLAVFQVSLVLVDLLVSEVSGFEVLAHLRRQKGLEEVPVVVISTQQLTAEQENAFNGVVIEAIKKQPPVRYDWVQRVIKAMV